MEKLTRCVRIEGRCSNATCGFHDGRFPDCCIRRYMITTSGLNIYEISLFLRCQPSQVQQVLNSALAKLRRYTIARAQSNGELDVEFDVVGTHACVVCEKPLHRIIPAHLRLSNGYGYCSDACASEKPYFVAQAELEYHVGIDTLLSWATHKFASSISAADALGMSKSELQQALWQRQGLDLWDCFSS